MDSSFLKDQKSEITASLRRYFSENHESQFSEIEANSLLAYFLSEIAPFAYNQGVADAQKYFASLTDDLAGTCFHEPMGYWKTRKSGAAGVRRKPCA